jgi:hypothetical protein
VKILVLLLIFLSFTASVRSQSTSTLIGARANALGYAASGLQDEWALFNNPAGLASVRDLTTGFAYEVRPHFTPFNRMAALAVIPTHAVVSGVGVYRFGDDLYNEHLITAAFSNKFGLASLGVKANYVQYNIEGFGRKGALGLSFGGLAELTPQLLVGAHIRNILQPSLSADGEERIPVVMNAGITFKPTPTLSLMAEAEKDLPHAILVKAALEYIVYERFVFRTGINLKPHSGFVGFGFTQKRFSVNYAASFFTPFGMTHQASVSYYMKPASK